METNGSETKTEQDEGKQEGDNTEQQDTGGEGRKVEGAKTEEPEGKGEVDANSSTGARSETPDTQGSGQGGSTESSGRGDDRGGGSPARPVKLPVRDEGSGGEADKGSETGSKGGDGTEAGGKGRDQVRKGFFYQRHRRERRTTAKENVKG